ncbi:putative membrane associated protein [Granulibacter bethesdensis]|uniref:Membrane associated protein n=1 Tax=Granulibacter bethesdensis TaxID=364410 RepID=A0AAC9KG08_9PROT|nr:putative membrane associated protein [Granulibacter bethesdensis]APH63205.1 putative membrane associated protein [Granulibacter bethesdensis]
MARLWSAAIIQAIPFFRQSLPDLRGHCVADIFDEVEEDLRAERAKKLLVRYGGPAVGLVLLVILGAAGWQGWLWYKHRQDAAAAERFLALTRNPVDPLAPPVHIVPDAKTEQALIAFAKDSPESYTTLARMRAAALLTAGGDKKGAEAIYATVSNDRAALPALRDLATLQSVLNQLDDGDPATLRGQLAPLLADGNPWQPFAREGTALLDIRQGRMDDAKRGLQRLSQDENAPPGVRNRATGLLAKFGG